MAARRDKLVMAAAQPVAPGLALPREGLYDYDAPDAIRPARVPEPQGAQR